MKNDLPSKIKRGKPTFIRIKANKKKMKYNNDNVRRQDRLLEEDRAYALLCEGEYGVLSMTTPTGGAYGSRSNSFGTGKKTSISTAPHEAASSTASPSIRRCLSV